MVVVVDPIGGSAPLIDDVARAATWSLTEVGHHVDVIDLVARRFSPVMSAADRRAYFSGEPLVDAQTAKDAELVARAWGLVFIYPTTLSTVTPGIKGWIDRTLVPGVAFNLDGGPRRGLSHLRHLAGISLYEQSRASVRRTGDNGRRLIRRNVRLCGGLHTRTHWLGWYGCASVSPAERSGFLDRVEREMMLT
jgi:putative NADPH-quinone reductase